MKRVFNECDSKPAVKSELALNKSIDTKEENFQIKTKIFTDCKLALQPDVHGNL